MTGRPQKVACQNMRTNPLPRLQYWRACLSHLILLGGVLSGCEQQVASRPISVSFPQWDPPIVCDADPRRADRVTISAECEDASPLTQTGKPGEMVELRLPVGTCQITAEVINKDNVSILKGELNVTLTSGDASPLLIPLTRTCQDQCDQDGDRLDDALEVPLSLDPKVADTDGDGVGDGAELLECCSDPRTDSEEDLCKMVLLTLTPQFAAVGDIAFAEVTTFPSEEVSLSYGNAPLRNLTTGTRTAFGRVDDSAVLGPVTITSGEDTLTEPGPFAVLRTSKQLVGALAASAPGNGPTVRTHLRSLVLGDRLAIYGTVGGTPTNPSGKPALVVYQRTPVEDRLRIDPNVDDESEVLDVAGRGNAVALLVREPVTAPGGDTAVVKVFRVFTGVGGTLESTTSVLKIARMGALSRGSASIAIDLDSVHGYVLTTQHGPVRFVLPTTPNETAQLSGGLSTASQFRAENCLGWTEYRAAKDATDAGPADSGTDGAVDGGSAPLDELYFFGACFVKCPPGGGPCNPSRIGITRMGPASRCFGDLTRADDTDETCHQYHEFTASGPTGAIMSSPVVDEINNRVYVAAQAQPTQPLQILSAAPDATVNGTVKIFAELPSRDISEAHPQLMALNDNILYLVSGQRVQQLQPAETGSARRGDSFPISELSVITSHIQPTMRKDAVDIALYEPGRAVSSELATVCLTRCSNCVCKTASP